MKKLKSFISIFLNIVQQILTAVMAMSLMVGCGSKKDDSSSKTYNLGIIQFAEHGSLDNCRKGFLKGLESEVSKKEKT